MDVVHFNSSLYVQVTLIGLNVCLADVTNTFTVHSLIGESARKLF